MLLDLIAGHAANHLAHVGLDHSRRHGVDADLPRRQFLGHGAGEAIDAPLAGGIIYLAAAQANSAAVLERFTMLPFRCIIIGCVTAWQ